MSPNKQAFDAAAIGLARLYGATLLMAAIIYWLSGTAAPSNARRALVTGALVSNVLGGLVGILNIMSGVYNSLLWVSILIWLLFALGFAYFQFIRRDAN
jgi:uncharacterized RDD family membrane protein YckC